MPTKKDLFRLIERLMGVRWLQSNDMVKQLAVRQDLTKYLKELRLELTGEAHNRDDAILFDQNRVLIKIIEEMLKREG